MAAATRSRRTLAPQDIVFAQELEELQHRRGIAVHYVIGDHAAPDGHLLLSPEHLGELVPDLAEREVYLCGPPAMMRAVEQNARRAGIPAKYIHTERFALAL